MSLQLPKDGAAIEIDGNRVRIADRTWTVPDFSNVVVRGWHVVDGAIAKRGEISWSPWSAEQMQRWERSVWWYRHFWRILPFPIGVHWSWRGFYVIVRFSRRLIISRSDGERWRSWVFGLDPDPARLTATVTENWLALTRAAA